MVWYRLGGRENKKSIAVQLVYQLTHTTMANLFISPCLVGTRHVWTDMDDVIVVSLSEWRIGRRDVMRRVVVRNECFGYGARVMVASRERKIEGSGDVVRGESLSQTEPRYYSLCVEPTYRDELWNIVRIRCTTPRTWLLDPSAGGCHHGLANSLSPL